MVSPAPLATASTATPTFVLDPVPQMHRAMNIDSMMNVLRRLRASVVFPMHWFTDSTLERFLAGMEGEFAITRPGTSEIEVSLRSLSDRPTIVVLRPAYLREEE